MNDTGRTRTGAAKQLCVFAVATCVLCVVTFPVAVGQRPQAVESANADSSSDDDCDCYPENTSDGILKTASEYAKLIEPELGVPPVVDLSETVEIPIYVDGKKTTGNLGIHCCDNPSLQQGDCMSGSSVGRHEGKAADGTPMPHVIWVSFCRHDGPSGVVGILGAGVQLIGYNTETGATAFFDSGDNRKWIRVDPESNRVLGVMPGIDDPDAFNTVYTTPGKIQCVQCHTDPFLHDPLIDAARLPEDPSQPVVPEITSPDSPFYVIGASHWDMRTIHIEGNGCLECHRLGMKAIEELVGDRWDPNEHMPPDDPGSMREDYRELLEAWKSGPDSAPGFQWIIPPAADCEGRVVGDDYPHKADFNQVDLRQLNKPRITAPLPPSKPGTSPFKSMTEDEKRTYFKALGMNEQEQREMLKQFGL